MSARSQWALLEFAVEVRRDPCVILHRSLSEDRGDAGEVFSNKSLHGLVQVLVRRPCGDPGKILSRKSLHEDLTNAMK